MNYRVIDKETYYRKGVFRHFDKEYPDEANEITHVSVIYREDMVFVLE